MEAPPPRARSAQPSLFHFLILLRLCSNFDQILGAVNFSKSRVFLLPAVFVRKSVQICYKLGESRINA